MSDAPPLLQITRLHKCYHVPVLLDFSLSVESGEVHALVGGNGAGKSTLARILAGLTTPDEGEIHLEGRAYRPTSKRAAEQAGVVLVLQELNVIGTLSLAENLFLNRLPQRAGFLRRQDLYFQAHQALSQVGLGHLDPAMPASRLGVGQQQLLEIAGALAKSQSASAPGLRTPPPSLTMEGRDGEWKRLELPGVSARTAFRESPSRACRVLILDEPTAALTDPEIRQLFAHIRHLQSQGVGILYVSHRMDELRRIADRITVLRDGRVIATHLAHAVPPAQLIAEMAGRELPVRSSQSVGVPGKVALHVRELHAGERVRGVNLELRYGEVLGLAGLIGSGRTETLRAIFGADPVQSGELQIDGRPVAIRSPADALQTGVGLVPEDRRAEGLLLPQPVRVNTTLSTLPRHTRFAGWLHAGSEQQTTEALCGRLEVGCASIEQTAGELSGGNQQKVMVARWLATDCRILLLDEPTRGIDAAAKHSLCQLIRQLAAAGKAVLVVSSELEELIAVCDRLLVLSQGKITGEFTPENWTLEKITRAAFSGHLDPAGGLPPDRTAFHAPERSSTSSPGLRPPSPPLIREGRDAERSRPGSSGGEVA